VITPKIFALNRAIQIIDAYRKPLTPPELSKGKKCSLAMLSKK